MKQIVYTKGYSLVEVLIATAILMIAIVGPLTIAAKSIQSTQYARQQITAFFLAQEGINAVQVLRNSAALAAFKVGDPSATWDWTQPGQVYDDCFTDRNPNGCNLDFADETIADSAVDCSTPSNCAMALDSDAGSRGPLYETGIAGGIYTRVIKLSPTSNPDEIMITSQVEWVSRLFGGTTESVVLQSSVLNVYK